MYRRAALPRKSIAGKVLLGGELHVLTPTIDPR
jgi:hypothetical protein